MTRLGQLQEALKRDGLSNEFNLAAITYDPAYDSPERLYGYSNYRGFITGEHHRCFRVIEGMDILLDQLKAGVNYNGSFVNHHATEFWLLNSEGMIEQKFTGTQWNIETVIRQLNVVRTRKQSKLSNWWNSFSSALLSFIMVFFPKCPFCAAAYLSLFGLTNLQFFQLRVWLIPILALLLAVNLFALFRMGIRRNWQLPFYISLCGAICVLLATFFKLQTGYVGIGLIITGSLLNALPKKFFRCFTQTLN